VFGLGSGTVAADGCGMPGRMSAKSFVPSLEFWTYMDVEHACTVLCEEPFQQAHEIPDHCLGISLTNFNAQ